jgi:hypothetical protein
MLGPLRYIYVGTPSARKDAEKIYAELKTEPRWWLEAFNTEVLSSGLGSDPRVEILLAEHRKGKPPIFIFQVDDIEAYPGESFRIPTGDGKMLLHLASIELAVFQETRPLAADESYHEKGNKNRRDLKGSRDA